jgi:hypothetical protein
MLAPRRGVLFQQPTPSLHPLNQPHPPPPHLPPTPSLPQMPAFMVFHVVNAWEEDDGKVCARGGGA